MTVLSSVEVPTGVAPAGIARRQLRRPRRFAGRPGDVPGHRSVDLDEVVSALFAAAEPPRFVLVCGGGMYALADRYSWSEGKLLAVDLSLALERNDTKPSGELATVAALFSADALVPVDGTAQIDELRDASLKHAVGVSKDLREGIRLSVELIANDVIEGLRARRQGVFNQPDLAKSLTRESLRFLYRLLFLLFAEARRELGILPVDAPEYAEGYGLDRLRDLALTKLTTEKAQTGTHIYDSLTLLFKLVNDGSGTSRQGQLAMDADEAEGNRELEFRPLKSSLFSDKATPFIDSVGLHNSTLQQVLQLLMLSKKRRGRDRWLAELQPARHQPARRRVRGPHGVHQLLRHRRPDRAASSGQGGQGFLGRRSAVSASTRSSA
ncbi:MAG: hypothetical protein R2713_12390 [Ilumatobacteraceae bacterium]